MNVAAWLRELGLERYEQAFQEGEIDREVLADLTDADLRELGIPVGPRRKLLKAISALAAARGLPRPTLARAAVSRVGLNPLRREKRSGPKPSGGS